MQAFHVITPSSVDQAVVSPVVPRGCAAADFRAVMVVRMFSAHRSCRWPASQVNGASGGERVARILPLCLPGYELQAGCALRERDSSGKPDAPAADTADGVPGRVACADESKVCEAAKPFSFPVAMMKTAQMSGFGRIWRIPVPDSRRSLRA